jgi:hypothetical protein
MRMPRPPPPAEALTMTGKPISPRDPHGLLDVRQDALATRHHRQARGLHRALGLGLVTHATDHLGVGPMNVKLHDSHTSTKCAFSDRKPYPGWIGIARR